MLADRTAASVGLPPPRACKQRSWDLQLDGDIRELLELAACLPDVILKRIARREEETPAGSLSRSAHRDDEVPSGSVGALVTDLAMMHGFQVPEAHSLAAAIERLVSLPPEQRASIMRLILTLDSNRDDE